MLLAQEQEMARRKQGAAGDFVDIIALLPWWVGIALALIGYLVLHRLAGMLQGTMQVGHSSEFIQRSLIAGFASIGQFVVPFICLLGTLVSFMRRRKRMALVETVTHSSSASALDNMSWREFELLVGEAFRRQGYKVTEQGGARPDGGVDLVLRKGNETFLVQCKQWKAFKVSVDIVRDLYGAMAARGAAGGFVVTSGRFTTAATEFAKGRNVKLIDGSVLFGLIRQAKASMSSGAATRAQQGSTPDQREATPVYKAAAEAETAPSCPVCQASMILRTARKGTKAGSQFWGCATYPSCRGTR